MTLITKFLTNVTTTVNPFSRRGGKIARTFLAQLPPNARQTMKINVKILPRESTVPNSLVLKFKDGKEMNLDVETMGIKDVNEQVDRHLRSLRRKEELSG
ncbi:hypothetical protein K402DRAFT_349464 [Aulographum hederae CBS 113979]|uniref:Large ribosomal subunit protein mL53 n=1 Tax=Aulographum hederae CBS 113979 TaxID=1176131 RepID=A0A6G1H963_9PEZI|nr:hypothetical protein K402DRAFT_349464 [Aulographum hederae CBS 113979]